MFNRQAGSVIHRMDNREHTLIVAWLPRPHTSQLIQFNSQVRDQSTDTHWCSLSRAWTTLCCMLRCPMCGQIHNKVFWETGPQIPALHMGGQPRAEFLQCFVPVVLCGWCHSFSLQLGSLLQPCQVSLHIHQRNWSRLGSPGC